MTHESGEMPPLIVVGVTGPVGSGCTTISNFFHVPGRLAKARNDLFGFLCRTARIVREDSGEAPSIDWGPISDDVDKAYRALARPDASREEGLREELSAILQQRGDYRALSRLLGYYRPESHLFRTISLSDVIIFHALRSLEAHGWTTEGVPARYTPFAKVCLEERDKRRFRKKPGTTFFGSSYESLHSQIGSSELGSVERDITYIHNIASEVKRAFREQHPELYTDLLQDFGNNVRKTGDPFRQDDFSKQNSRILAKDCKRMIELLYQSQKAAFFVLDCLRNPYEVMYLRNNFARFYLFSCYADYDLRKQRLADCRSGTWFRVNKDTAAQVFALADERDSGSQISGPREQLFLQNVTQCVRISDVSVNNNTSISLKIRYKD